MMDSPNMPQPKPRPGSGPAIPDLVVTDIRERDAAGTKKYGQRLQAHDGRNHLIDAYQEALDLVMYLRQEIEERATTKKVLEVQPGSVRKDYLLTETPAEPSGNTGELPATEQPRIWRCSTADGSSRSPVDTESRVRLYAQKWVGGGMKPFIVQYSTDNGETWIDEQAEREGK